MFSMKLLIAFAMLTGIAAEQCSLGDFGVEDFADKVIVTNTSESADAFVAIKSNHGQVTVLVPAGESRSVIALASTKYTAVVTEPGSTDYGSYRTRLLGLRDYLVGLTQTPEASLDAITNAWTELTLVQAALDQMRDSRTLQSCGGPLTTDAPSHVSVKWAKTADGAALWVLDCG